MSDFEYSLFVKGEFITSVFGNHEDAYETFVERLRPLCYLMNNVRIPEAMNFSAIKYVANVYNRNHKIEAIKCVRAFFDLGLGDAKALAEFCALVDYRLEEPVAVGTPTFEA